MAILEKSISSHNFGINFLISSLPRKSISTATKKDSTHQHNNQAIMLFSNFSLHRSNDNYQDPSLLDESWHDEPLFSSAARREKEDKRCSRTDPSASPASQNRRIRFYDRKTRKSKFLSKSGKRRLSEWKATPDLCDVTECESVNSGSINGGEDFVDDPVIDDKKKFRIRSITYDCVSGRKMVSIIVHR